MRFRFATLALAPLLVLAGCSSKPAEVDEAEVQIKQGPAEAAPATPAVETSKPAPAAAPTPAPAETKPPM